MKSDVIITPAELLTLTEAAIKYNVSTRTIERHATIRGQKTIPTIRNNKKVNGYSLEWLEDIFGDKSDNSELLTLIEAAAKYNISTRTIERHATISKYKSNFIFKNNKKVKGYSLKWLESVFGKKSDNFESTTRQLDENDRQNAHKIDNDRQSNDTDVVKVLSEHVTFLRKEIDIKNDQIAKLQESEKNTKMLLADLQIQNKALQAPQPDQTATITKPVNKSKTLWWVVAVVIVIGLAGAGAYAMHYYGRW